MVCASEGGCFGHPFTFQDTMDAVQEGIRRLTSDPAHRFLIPERGRLVEGAPADMLLFDPAAVGISKAQSGRGLAHGARATRRPWGMGQWCADP